MSARFALSLQRPTSAQLLAHARALLAIVRPHDLRKPCVQNALLSLADALGDGLSADQIRDVLSAAPPGKRSH